MSGCRLVKFKIFRRFFCHTGPSKRLRVLGIETSCDDTGVAVVDSDRNILGEVKYSQSQIHAMHGGIMPPLARDLHHVNIRKAVEEVLEKSKLSIKDVDGIAVTVKPGLPCSLQVGIEFAKDLCTLYNKPLIPIHHMEAHALTVRILEDVEFPFPVLLTSGGHCILALAKSVTTFIILGESSDIAPGLVLDKIGRRLNLRNFEKLVLMQGGEAVETAAKKGNPLSVEFKFFVNHKRDCNFFYSGFQTSVETFIEAEEKRHNIIANQTLPNVYDISASAQFRLFKYICERLEIGLRYLDMKKLVDEEDRTLVVSGGVASNEFLRKMLKYVCDNYHYKLKVPPKNLCTDNGVMIAWNAIERLRINIPTVGPDEIHLIQPIARCNLGENVTKEIRDTAWKGSYLKYAKFVQKEMEEQPKNLTSEPISNVNSIS